MTRYSWWEQQESGDSIVTLTVMQKAFETIKDIAQPSSIILYPKNEEDRAKLIAWNEETK